MHIMQAGRPTLVPFTPVSQQGCKQGKLTNSPLVLALFLNGQNLSCKQNILKTPLYTID